MADVQLEHGYLKLANRLMEAIIEARFSERQLGVLLVLLRQTYGWRRRSVQLTELELAEYSGAVSGDAKRAGGSFRADLHELLTQGVIVRLESAGKRGLMTWAINKDFETWGRFSSAPARLEARWNPKPLSSTGDDAAITAELAQKQATSSPGERPEIGPDESSEWPESGPSNEGQWPGDGPDSGPGTGQIVARSRASSPSQPVQNSALRPSERQGKTEKDKKQLPRARARDPYRLVAEIRALARSNGVSRFIPIEDVRKLGKDVLGAYTAVGGATRFLDETPQNLKWLPTDFGKALSASAPEPHGAEHLEDP